MANQENKGKQNTNTKTKAGYEYLLAYKVTVPIYDYSVVFADRWISKFSRTKDQWEQAARSGTQNIPEGYTQQSLAGYIKLTGVARGSLEELLKDCLAFARQNGLQVWSAEKSKREIGELGEIWEILRNNPYLPDNPSFPSLPEDRERALNLLITLINQANTLIDRLIESLKEKHTREGGFNEKLLQRRLTYRRSHLFSLILFPLISLLSLIFLISPSPVSAANSGIFTVSAWVKPETSIASKAIVGKSEELRVFTDASGYVGCQIKSTTWQTAAQATATALTLNAWSHVACTYDKINLKVYVNGVSVATQALTATVDDTANALKYGIDDSASTPYSALKGTIDELKFYNYARTQKQIVEDMLGSPNRAVGGGGGNAHQPAVAYYSFDEGQGTVANNSGFGGSALNGTLGASTAAPTWSQNGKFGKALSFDGNDYVYTSNNSSINPLNSFTLSAWVNPNSVTSKAILVKDTAYRLFTDANGKINCQVYSSGAWQTAAVSSNALTLNQWQHIACTYDKARGSIKDYKGGLEDGTSSVAVDINQPSTELRVGSDGGGTYGFFSGLIDDVKIYNYALTEDEVKTEYNRGGALVLGSLSSGTGNTAPSTAASQEYCIPGDASTCSPPVARWDFNEGVGTTAMDTSGNGNTGTLGTGSSAPGWSTGKVGKGLRFDGSNDYVYANNSLTINPAAALWSVSTWIKTSGTDSIVLCKSNSSTDCSSVGIDHYALKVDSNGKAVYEFSSGDALVNPTSTTTINDNQWHYISGVRTAVRTGQIFVDGRLENTHTPAGAGSGIDTTLALYIGQYNSTNNFNGLIDQVRIYNYARTPAQIAWDYNRGGPILHYRMDECEGTTVHSASKPLNASLNGTLNIGASGTQTTAGTCTDGLAGSAWSNGATGKINSSLNFDGSDDYVDVGDISRTDITTLSFWAKPSSTTQKIIELSASDSVEILGGVVTVAGYGTETVYVDGRLGTSFPDANWHHVTVVSSAGLTANAIAIGKISTNYYSGQIDEVKIFNYDLTSTQVKELYNGGAVSFK